MAAERYRLVHADGRPLGRMKVGTMNPYFEFDTEAEAEAVLATWRAERAALTPEFRRAHWIPATDDYSVVKLDPSESLPSGENVPDVP